MSVIAGTIRSIDLLRGPDNQSATRRYVYHVTADFATTTAGDTITVASIATAIATTNSKSGKTLQLREATTGAPGQSDGGTAVYGSAVTVSSGTIAANIGGPTAVAAVGGCKGVGFIAVLDEASA